MTWAIQPRGVLKIKGYGRVWRGMEGMKGMEGMEGYGRVW